MKKVIMLCCCLMSLFVSNAQNEIQNNITPLQINNGKISANQLSPLISKMSNYQIVGLGEGTHGSKEFNDIRIDIIKELIEKKGFRILCFENAFGDSYYFNRLLNSNEDITIGMKKYLISLWQTKELKGLFEWIRKFNRQHSDKVIFTGMDFNYFKNAADIIKDELLKSNNQTLLSLSNELIKNASFCDSAWNEQLKNVSIDDFVSKVQTGYFKSKEIDSIVKTNKINVSDNYKNAILNCSFWANGEEGRDSGMAVMATNIAEKNKMIVWGHSVHLALKSCFNDNEVGGCGGYIKQQIPSYFVLGTGTANGTYSGTPERFDTYVNQMFSYPLPSVKENTWDKFFADKNQAALLINFNKVKNDTTKLPLRLIGYGTPEGIGYSDKVNLTQLFDAYIFIKNTTASNHQL